MATDAAAPESTTTVGAEAPLHARMAAARPDLDDPVIAAAMARLRSAHGVGMPERIGRHHLRRCLGVGGFAHVYAADDPLLSRTVAIKLPLAGTAALDDRFRHEAQVLAQLEHPNIVRIFDVGRREDGRSAFIVMELVEGSTLAAWLSSPHPLATTLAVFHNAARGVAAAHAHGILHRDLKPSNILVGVDGVAKVADFGIARVRVVTTAEDVVADRPEPWAARDDASFDGCHASGTPRYMAPEQREGRATDERSDIYSFAVTLFEALFGDLPRYDRDGRAIIPSRPRIPSRVRRALERSLRPRPSDRMQQMAEWITALRPSAPRTRLLAMVAIAACLPVAVAAAGMFRSPSVAAPPGDAVVEGDLVLVEDPAITAALADVDARIEAYDIAGAATELDRLEREATQRDDQLTALRVKLRRALAASTAGLDRVADALLREVVQTSEHLDDPRTKASAHLGLAIGAAIGSRDRSQSELQLGHARAAIARAGSPCDLVFAALARDGELLRIHGQAPAAVAILGAVTSGAASCPLLHERQRSHFVEALAFAELMAGDGAGAEARLRRLVADQERAWGPDDPRLIGPLTNLALAGGTRRAMADSEAYAQRVVTLAERNHLDRGTIDAAISDLAMTWIIRGRHDEGLPLLDEVLQRRIARGAFALRIAEARLRLGQHAIEAGRYQLGLAHAWAAVSEFEAASGESDLGAAIARISVAVASSGVGDEQGAADQYRLVLERFTPLLGRHHPLTLAAASNLVKSELRMQHLDAAARAVADLEDALGDDTHLPERAAMLEHMRSMLAYRRDRPAEALALARRAVEHFGHDEGFDATSAKGWLAVLEAREQPTELDIYNAIR